MVVTDTSMAVTVTSRLQLEEVSLRRLTYIKRPSWDLILEVSSSEDICLLACLLFFFSPLLVC